VETFWLETGWALPSAAATTRFVARLISAAVLGGLVGWEREARGRAAGLRTHMMVALGAALFVLVTLESGGHDVAYLVKGIAAGIGFLGAGAILKLTDEREIRGLTTASSIWLTAAVGMAAGLGQQWLGLVAVAISLLILFVVGRWEGQRNGQSSPPQRND
jgi:putative Mg2+ transporter-C (MgtC) family protein